MAMLVREYDDAYLADTMRIWNEIVEEGVAFPQEEILDEEQAGAFFHAQTYTGIALEKETNQVLGMYILHPNNVGRCGHIANASYAVASGVRGKHIGEMLVLDCLERAREKGFSLLQFNAVVDNNLHARHLYQRLGFKEVGTIPGGFRMKDGHFEDIHVMYISL